MDHGRNAYVPVVASGNDQQLNMVLVIVCKEIDVRFLIFAHSIVGQVVALQNRNAGSNPQFVPTATTGEFNRSRAKNVSSWKPFRLLPFVSMESSLV
jgi:hypothetical protein